MKRYIPTIIHHYLAHHTATYFPKLITAFAAMTLATIPANAHTQPHQSKPNQSQSAIASSLSTTTSQILNYKPDNISLDFENIDIEILLSLFDLSGFDDGRFVVKGNLEGKVAVSLTNVPKRQAFDAILLSKGFYAHKQDDVTIIEPIDNLVTQDVINRLPQNKQICDKSSSLAVSGINVRSALYNLAKHTQTNLIINDGVDATGQLSFAMHNQSVCKILNTILADKNLEIVPLADIMIIQPHTPKQTS